MLKTKICLIFNVLTLNWRFDTTSLFMHKGLKALNSFTVLYSSKKKTLLLLQVTTLHNCKQNDTFM